MTLSLYCHQCNQIVGHIHIKYQKEILAKEFKIKENPKINGEILESYGLKNDCCKNTVMSNLCDPHLQSYLDSLNIKKE